MFKRKRSAEDFAEEIKAHLELESDDLRADGLSERNRNAAPALSSATFVSHRRSFVCAAVGKLSTRSRATFASACDRF